VIALLKYFKYGNLAIGPGEDSDDDVPDSPRPPSSGKETGK